MACRFGDTHGADLLGPTFVRISGPEEGEPLVLLPGIASSSLMWAPNIADLSAEFRTFAIDRVGDFGRSLCTRDPHTFHDLVAWLAETLDGLGLRDGVHLVGISYGGALAAEFARQRPERVRKAVLIAPGATVLGLSSEMMVRLSVATVAHVRGLDWLMGWLFEDAGRKDPAWLAGILTQLHLHMRSVRRVAPMPHVWSDAEWGALSVPTLFLVGEHEKIYPAAKAVERLRRVAPQIRTAVIPGAGHDVTFVQAGEVNRRILEFLRAPGT
jgi:pimeloyl-ACP methyl ester carboxylesterase